MKLSSVKTVQFGEYRGRVVVAATLLRALSSSRRDYGQVVYLEGTHGRLPTKGRPANFLREHITALLLSTTAALWFPKRSVSHCDLECQGSGRLVGRERSLNNASKSVEQACHLLKTGSPTRLFLTMIYRHVVVARYLSLYHDDHV